MDVSPSSRGQFLRRSQVKVCTTMKGLGANRSLLLVSSLEMAFGEQYKKDRSVDLRIVFGKTPTFLCFRRLTQCLSFALSSSANPTAVQLQICQMNFTAYLQGQETLRVARTLPACAVPVRLLLLSCSFTVLIITSPGLVPVSYNRAEARPAVTVSSLRSSGTINCTQGNTFTLTLRVI